MTRLAAAAAEMADEPDRQSGQADNRSGLPRLFAGVADARIHRQAAALHRCITHRSDLRFELL